MSQGNSSAPFQALSCIGSDPAGLYDGVWPAGHGGIECPQRVFLLPFAADNPGNQFSMRVYGWRAIANPPVQGTVVWIPYLIAELACTASNIGGPPNTSPGPSTTILKDEELLCDTISLTQGSLGLTGLINSTGPGSNLVAYAILELTGCRYFQFDFNVNPADQVGANVLWARGP